MNIAHYPDCAETRCLDQPYTRGHILRFGHYALDMVNLPDPLDPQPPSFEQTR